MTPFLFAFVMLMLYPVSLGTPSATLLMQMDNVIIHEADMKDVGMMLSLVSDHSYGTNKISPKLNLLPLYKVIMLLVPHSKEHNYFHWHGIVRYHLKSLQVNIRLPIWTAVA